MERYSIRDHAKFGADFRRLLPGIPLEELYDGLLTISQGYLSIDLIALERNLEMMFSNEWEHMSMEELITVHFGKEATELINKAL